MQFVTNGPDIPGALLRAHDEGRVGFFAVLGFPTQRGCLDLKGWWMTSIATMEHSVPLLKMMRTAADNMTLH